MAGLDQASNGEARLTPGYSVGILLQEPPLNESKTVLGNVEEGVGEIKAKLDRYNEIADQMADDYSDELMAEMGKLQEELDHARRLGPGLPARAGHGRAALPAAGRRRHGALRRRAPPRRAVQAAAAEARPAAARRAHQPPGRRVACSGWSSTWRSTPGAVLAVTHDRYFLDNVAQWILELDRGRAYPYEGNYSTYLENKAARLEVEGQKDAKLQKRLPRTSWSGSAPTPRPGRPRARRGWPRYEEMAAEADKTRKLDFEEIQIPPGPRLGNVVIEANDLTKGFGDRVLIDDLSFTLPRNGIVGVIGPNGVGKTTLFKTIVGHGEAGRRRGQGRRDGQDLLRRPEPRRHRPEEDVWEVVSDGLDYIKVGQVEMPVPRLRRGVRLQGPGPAEAGRRALRRRAQPAQPGADPQAGRQPAAARRADQRPGRRDAGSLENALLEFPGCAVVISHDRWFLDRVATHILAYEGDDEDPAKWFWFEGNFESYEKNKVERLGAGGGPSAPGHLPQAHPRLSPVSRP